MNFDITKLLKNSDYISPGSIGGKIKRIRELRGYTQKELGLKCGFSASTADVRIAQYEKNKKTPREKVLKDIAAALDIDECALFDADLLSYNHMYHALFDMEDFHGLHPVKINGRFYLEFSGPTIIGNEVQSTDFIDFLSNWSEMYQKYHSNSPETEGSHNLKANEYNLWRFEYPHNIATDTAREMKNLMKMNRLQAQMDELNAEMKSKTELARIDKAFHYDTQLIKRSYKNITLSSEFIFQVMKMIDAGMSLTQFAPDEKLYPESIHVISFKTESLLADKKNYSLFAEFLCQIETMQNYGIQIDRKITSSKNELFLTYHISPRHYKVISNLLKYWDEINFIAERRKHWSKHEIEDYENKLKLKITGTNDVLLNSI